MNLFEAAISKNDNLLPYGGEVYYHHKFLTSSEAASYFDTLSSEITWEHDRVVMFGKEVTAKRKVAWYGDLPFDYKYAKVIKTALPWTEHLLGLKKLVELEVGEQFNSCLLNYYHNGSEAMGWHSDDEKELLKFGAIASLSLGANRDFQFRNKQTTEKIELTLENGSLLLMKGETQRPWQHQLKKSVKVKIPRINLTFRKIKEATRKKLLLS